MLDHVKLIFVRASNPGSLLPPTRHYVFGPCQVRILQGTMPWPVSIDGVQFGDIEIGDGFRGAIRPDHRSAASSYLVDTDLDRLVGKMVDCALRDWDTTTLLSAASFGRAVAAGFSDFVNDYIRGRSGDLRALYAEAMAEYQRVTDLPSLYKATSLHPDPLYVSYAEHAFACELAAIYHRET